jgi:hypothetical protein
VLLAAAGCGRPTPPRPTLLAAREKEVSATPITEAELDLDQSVKDLLAARCEHEVPTYLRRVPHGVMSPRRTKRC